MNAAGFFRFDVHFFDGAEQNATVSYMRRITRMPLRRFVIWLMMKTSRISRLKVWSPGEVLLMPDWIADKITKYDYFASDYAREDKNVQFKNVNSVLSAEKTDEVMKEIEKHLTSGNYGPSDKLPLSQQSIEYINECVANGLPIQIPDHRGEI